jgi:hypothetical protein
MPPRIHHFQRVLPIGLHRVGLHRVLPLGALLLAATACGLLSEGPAPERDPDLPRPRPGATMQPEPFSAERAWAHLVALSELGPRPTGSTANAEALEYIRTRLVELDLEVFDLEFTDEPEPMAEGEGEDEQDAEATSAEDEQDAEAPPPEDEQDAEAAPPDEPPTVVRHLAARIPGESPDSILLVAHYDTRPGTPGANDGASGPAVLLEVVRQLVARPLPYTVEVAFVDADMGLDEKDPTAPSLEGSRLLVDYLIEAGTLDIVRLAVVLRQVGDADLTIGRDLHSHRMHRETFFEVAEDLGYADVFAAGRGYVESRSSHRPFVEAAMPRVVVLHDPWYGGEEPPGEYWGGEHDTREHCSPESLEAVGVVTLAALRKISARLEKVDLVSGRAARRAAERDAPAELVGEPVEEPTPGPEDAPMPEGGAAPPEAEMQAPETEAPAVDGEDAPMGGEEAPMDGEEPSEPPGEGDADAAQGAAGTAP